MKKIYDEGIREINHRPIPVECLVMTKQGSGISRNWDTLHYHKYIELLYVLEGEYQVYIDGREYAVPKGGMTVANAGELHATRGAEERSTLLCIKFLPQILYSSEQTVTEMEYSIPYVFEHFGGKRIFYAEELGNSVLPAAFSQICKEMQENGFGYELAIRAEVMRIFAWILRYWHVGAQNQTVPLLAPSLAALISKAREYVRAHYADATVREAAEVCGVSYSYFSRTFSRVMKMNFSHYVNLERINQSMKELALTNRSITEIALDCGFASASYYIQTFRRIKHISPNQFRKHLQKTES